MQVQKREAARRSRQRLRQLRHRIGHLDVRLPADEHRSAHPGQRQRHTGFVSRHRAGRRLAPPALCEPSGHPRDATVQRASRRPLAGAADATLNDPAVTTPTAWVPAVATPPTAQTVPTCRLASRLVDLHAGHLQRRISLQHVDGRRVPEQAVLVPAGCLLLRLHQLPAPTSGPSTTSRRGSSAARPTASHASVNVGPTTWNAGNARVPTSRPRNNALDIDGTTTRRRPRTARRPEHHDLRTSRRRPHRRSRATQINRRRLRVAHGEDRRHSSRTPTVDHHAADRRPACSGASTVA